MTGVHRRQHCFYGLQLLRSFLLPQPDQFKHKVSACVDLCNVKLAARVCTAGLGIDPQPGACADLCSHVEAPIGNDQAPAPFLGAEKRLGQSYTLSVLFQPAAESSGQRAALHKADTVRASKHRFRVAIGPSGPQR